MRIAPGSKPHHLPREWAEKRELSWGPKKHEGAEGGRALAELSFAWPDLVQPEAESLLSKNSSALPPICLFLPPVGRVLMHGTPSVLWSNALGTP